MTIPPYVLGLRKQVGNELLMLPSVSAVVFNDDGEILLGQRVDNREWSLIAGVMEPGEQPAEALVREIFEETGVHAVVERLLGVALHPVTYGNGDECQFLNSFFRARAVSGTARVNDDESLAVGWFSLDALPPMDSLVQLRIEVALRDDAPAWFAEPGKYYEALAPRMPVKGAPA